MWLYDFLFYLFTENDAKQIIEMFAEQYSEYISGKL